MSKKLSTKTKLAFACGDVFGGGAYNVVNFLYPAYAALTLGLGAGLAGVVVMVSKIWDAVTDPLMGHISDRTQSRMGKRRIYILAACPLVLLSLFLLFFPWSTGWSTAAKFCAALACYIFFSTVQTMVMIPYYSLASEISADYTERAKANTVRLAFSVTASIICVAVPNLIINAVGQPDGYVVMSLTFGALFALTLLVTALFAKEEIITPKNNEKFSVKLFVRPIKSKSFRRYLAMHVCSGVTMAVMSSVFFFYVMYVVKSGNTLAHGGVGDGFGTVMAGVMFVMQIFALPFYLYLIKSKGKMFAYRFGAAVWIVLALSLLFLPANVSDDLNWLLFVFAAVMGFGISGAVLVPHTMIGDVNDACQLQFGERTEGAVSGLFNFANKTAQALGVGIALNALELLGGFKNPPPGQFVAVQPASAQLALACIMAFTPLVFMGIGFVVSFGYKITAKKQAEIAEFNRKRDLGETQENAEDILNTL